MNENYAISEYVTSEDIKRIRKELKMTQKEFANLICVSKPTIERWEMSKEKITGPIVLVLSLLSYNNEIINNLVLPKKEYSLRMYYMYKQNICTLIDVDELNQRIKINNYTSNIFFKAFGCNNNPSYDDYKEFLKSRCFPETRDKLKLVLDDLDIPFYDPFLIIKKTEGRMAEDDFWIKVEE